MPFLRPTISSLQERVRGDLRDGLGLSAILRRTWAFAFSTAIAGLAHELHGRASYIATQLFVDQMAIEELERYGAIYNLPRKSATFTKLNMRFTGTDGVNIPILEQYSRNDGETYETDAAYLIPSAVAGVSEVFTVTTVADSSGSLNDTFFEFSTVDNDYYVWHNVDSAGTDPSLTGKTGIEVAIVQNDIADDVASAVSGAVGLVVDVNTVAATNVVTVTLVDSGVVVDVADGAAPTGYALLVTTQGVDAVIGGQVDGVVTADNSGDVTNLDVGELLSLSSAIVGIDSDATVLSTAVEGEDIEDIELYRQRILDRLREPPHGGNVDDYIAWAKTVAGITRAWVYDAPTGVGTVSVATVEDDEDPIFPSVSKVAEVQAVLDVEKPVTARVTAISPIAAPINFIIQISPNTQAVRDTVETELRDLIRRDAAPAGAVDDPAIGSKHDGKILLSKIRESVSRAAGEEDNVVVSPTADVEPLDFEMASIGTITWQGL